MSGPAIAAVEAETPNFGNQWNSSVAAVGYTLAQIGVIVAFLGEANETLGQVGEMFSGKDGKPASPMNMILGALIPGGKKS